jgi:hypothetical protein
MAQQKRLINKSRTVGSRKRPPKPTETPSETPVVDPTPSEPSSVTPVINPTPSQPLVTQTTVTQPNLVTITRPKATAFTGLSQVPHGLAFSSFDPNSYFAKDLFSDSSPLSRTTKADADEIVQSIEEKRQTVRIAIANIGLNQDVVRAGNEYQKLEGLAIDYATTSVNNESKFIGYQTAEVNRDIAYNRYDQAGERLAQGQTTLNGMRSITPLIEQEWDERKNLKLSQIKSLKIEATKAKEALEPKLMQLSQNFRTELEEMA